MSLDLCVISVYAGDKTSAAIDELSMLLGFLRVWGLEKVVNIDALMSPTEEYFDAIYFQVAIFQQTRNFTILFQSSSIDQNRI